MGTYCELLVADYPVFPEKSKASAIAMTMFRESDKVIAVRPTSARNSIEWGHVEWDLQETETVFEYTASVAAVKDRLRVMGFTLSRVKVEFARVKAAHLAWLTEMAQDSPELWSEEIALLSASMFEDFLRALKEIVTSGVHYVRVAEQVPTTSALARYMLRDHEEFYWGFPCEDLCCFFRAVLEVVPDTASVTQELTDLVHGGYYAEDARVTDLALQELKGSYSVNSPVVVLTEGTTDGEVIRAAVELLHPHLAGYYAFMDLVAVRAPGGAGSLVHVVKSFTGAGIENRVIALFDNDTAGHSAADVLRGIPLPPTVRVLHYPNLELARSYPTVGPSGASVQDINGSACSIELYFGRDVLVDGTGLIPVQWKGFDDRMKRYQGEVQQKQVLKDRYFAKIASAKADRSRLQQQDWTAMDLLLCAMFDAYN